MKSYLGLAIGMTVGLVQHYYYMKMLARQSRTWYGFKPLAKSIDRRLNTPKRV
jgi:hypothetical protein